MKPLPLTRELIHLAERLLPAKRPQDALDQPQELLAQALSTAIRRTWHCSSTTSARSPCRTLAPGYAESIRRLPRAPTKALNRILLAIERVSGAMRFWRLAIGRFRQLQIVRKRRRPWARLEPAPGHTPGTCTSRSWIEGHCSGRWVATASHRRGARRRAVQPAPLRWSATRTICDALLGWIGPSTTTSPLVEEWRMPRRR